MKQMATEEGTGCQARRQDFAIGGSKEQKGGGHIFKYDIGCMQQPEGQTWNGGDRFQMGGRAPLAPPLAKAMGWTYKSEDSGRQRFAGGQNERIIALSSV